MRDIQVVLVEDDEQTRVHLRAALRAQEGIEVASEATNGTTGLVLLESIDVDVAIVDSSLPDMSAMEFAAHTLAVQSEACVIPSKLLFLLDPTKEDSWQSAIAIGKASYCLKNAPINQLAEAVRITQAGERYCDPAIAVFVKGNAP